MKEKNLIQNLIGSFNTKPGDGFAARKLSAFMCFCLVVFIHVKFCNDQNAFDFLIADYSVGLLLLSIVTIQDIIKLKNGIDTGTISEKTGSAEGRD